MQLAKALVTVAGAGHVQALRNVKRWGFMFDPHDDRPGAVAVRRGIMTDLNRWRCVERDTDGMRLTRVGAAFLSMGGYRDRVPATCD